MLVDRATREVKAGGSLSPRVQGYSSFKYGVTASLLSSLGDRRPILNNNRKTERHK